MRRSLHTAARCGVEVKYPRADRGCACVGSRWRDLGDEVVRKMFVRKEREKNEMLNMSGLKASDVSKTDRKRSTSVEIKAKGEETTAQPSKSKAPNDNEKATKDRRMQQETQQQRRRT